MSTYLSVCLYLCVHVCMCVCAYTGISMSKMMYTTLQQGSLFQSSVIPHHVAVHDLRMSHGAMNVMKARMKKRSCPPSSPYLQI